MFDKKKKKNNKTRAFQEYVVKISFENLSVSTLQLQEARN